MSNGKSKKAKSVISVIAIILIAAVLFVIKNGSNPDELVPSAVGTETFTYESPEASKSASAYSGLTFRSSKLLTSHFEKHGREVGAANESEYVDKANAVINNPSALHKNEAEDNDDVYFLKQTGEIVFVSSDGFIRTYFISDEAYFNRQ